MARQEIKTSIKLGHDNGMKDGKQQISYQSFTDIVRSADDADILKFSKAIDNLSEKEVILTFNIAEDEVRPDHP